MRFAKAEYIRALKDLRAADAELQRALAAVELANARYRDAETANLNADTEYQNLLNEYQKLINEARQDTNSVISQETASKIDSIKKRMELRELQHQKDMVAAQDSLANAQERLRVALRNIALYSQSLTPAEKEALENATKAYEIAFEKVANQTVKVFKAQQRLDSAKIMLARTDKAVAADSSFVDYREYYQTQLEAAQVKAALSGLALAAIGYNFDNPTDTSSIIIPEDLAEWKDEIAAFEDSVNALKYSKADIRNDIANYYVANIHDGYTTFNNKVAEFKDEWWDKSVTPAKEPTAPEAPGAEPKASDYKANDYLSDSLAFSPFAKTKDISPETFNKFVYLLSSYNVDAPDSKADPKNKIMKTNTAADTLFIVGPVSQKSGKNMKTFILGAAGNGEESQTYKKIKANYGLWGAYDILEREMVTAKKSAADTADLRETMEEADSIWTAHRQILIDGLAAYEPYAEAIAKYEADVATNGAGATAMVAAIVEIKKQLDAVNGDANFASVTINDSTAIFDALVAFAKARENYLEYDTTAGPHNLNYLRFATGYAGGKPIVDSVKFSAMTWDDFAAHKYDFSYDGEAPISHTTANNASPLNQEDGLANIANQLLGTTIGGKFLYPLTTGAVTTANFNTAALYGGQYTVDDYEDPTEILEGGSTYEPSNLADDRDAIKDAIDDYVDVYNSFWSLSVTADMSKYTEATTGYYDVVEAGKKAADIAKAKTAAEAQVIKAWPYDVDDVKGYTLATFKPYADEAPIVYYTNGSTIDKTTAMKAILTAVDPKSTDKTDNTQWDAGTFESKSAIFKDGATDFAAFMKASYDYYLATTTTLVQDLAVVKAWIEGVEATFASDETAAPGEATKAYNTAHSTWQTKKDTYDTKKAKWDEYAAAKAAFVGTRPVKEGETEDWVDADGNKVKFYAFVEFTDNQYDKFSKFFDGNNDEVTFKYVDKDPIYDVYTGKWVKEIAGKQLEIANTLFPKLPENMKTWQNSLDAINDKISHFETLAKAYNSAYTDAAKAKYDVDGSKLKDVIKNVQKDILDDFAEVIEAYEKAVGTKTVEGDIQKYTKKIRDYEKDVILGQVHPAQFALEDAKAALAIETARLQGYQEVLAYAKANLDKILEYIKSLDVNFVVVTDKDIENQQK